MRPMTDVIVLAGDIGNQTYGLEWAAHRFKGMMC